MRDPVACKAIWKRKTGPISPMVGGGNSVPGLRSGTAFGRERPGVGDGGLRASGSDRREVDLSARKPCEIGDFGPTSIARPRSFQNIRLIEVPRLLLTFELTRCPHNLEVVPQAISCRRAARRTVLGHARARKARSMAEPELHLRTIVGLTGQFPQECAIKPS